jgi:hypothetical protein
MSDASDSQNMSEQHIDLSAGSSPAESFYEGERSSPDLPKLATRTRKKRTSDSEDEDFVASEATKKKRVMLAKEYSTKPTSAKEKTSVKKVTKETMQITLEVPSDIELAAGGKKKRARKTTAHVLGRPSMRNDSEEEEEPAASAPPAKAQKLMSDAIRTAAPTKSKPKVSAPKRSTTNISAAEKNKVPVPEANVNEEPLVLKKLKPKIPDHDDAHLVVENMMLRKDKGLHQWRKSDPYAARRKTACDYRFHTRGQQNFL